MSYAWEVVGMVHQPLPEREVLMVYQAMGVKLVLRPDMRVELRGSIYDGRVKVSSWLPWKRVKPGEVFRIQVWDHGKVTVKVVEAKRLTVLSKLRYALDMTKKMLK